MSSLQQNAVIAAGLSLCLGVLTGCDSSSAGSDSQEAEIVYYSAGSGTIQGATVTLEEYVDGAEWQLLETTTSDDAGEFTFENSSFNADSWYRFTSTLGTIADPNLDGDSDDSKAFIGTQRTLAKGEWLTDFGGANITALTETAYVDSLANLSGDIDWTNVESNLDKVAASILNTDANEDGEVNYQDLLRISDDDLGDLHIILQEQYRNVTEHVANGYSSVLYWTNAQLTSALNTLGGTIYDAEFNADGSILYAASLRNGLYIYDLLTGEASEVNTPTDTHYDLTLDEANNRVFLHNGRSNGVYEIDLETESIVDTFLTDVRANALVVNDAGDTLYYGNSDGFHQYDLANGTTQSVTANYVQRLRLSEDQSTLYVNGNDYIAAYQFSTGSFVYNIELNDSAYDTFLSADGNTAYVANSGEGLTVVDLTTEAFESFDAPDDESVYSLVLQEDEGRLLVVSESEVFTFSLESQTFVDSDYNFDFEDSNYVAAFSETQWYVGCWRRVRNCACLHRIRSQRIGRRLWWFAN